MKRSSRYTANADFGDEFEMALLETLNVKALTHNVPQLNTCCTIHQNKRVIDCYLETEDLAGKPCHSGNQNCSGGGNYSDATKNLPQPDFLSSSCSVELTTKEFYSDCYAMPNCADFKSGILPNHDKSSLPRLLELLDVLGTRSTHKNMRMFRQSSVADDEYDDYTYDYEDILTDIINHFIQKNRHQIPLQVNDEDNVNYDAEGNTGRPISCAEPICCKCAHMTDDEQLISHIIDANSLQNTVQDKMEQEQLITKDVLAGVRDEIPQLCINTEVKDFSTNHGASKKMAKVTAYLDDFKRENYGITSDPKEELENSTRSVVEHQGYWHKIYQNSGINQEEYSPVDCRIYNTIAEVNERFLTSPSRPGLIPIPKPLYIECHGRVSVDQIPDTVTVVPLQCRPTIHPPLYPGMQEKQNMMTAAGFKKNDPDELRQDALEMSYTIRIVDNVTKDRIPLRTRPSPCHIIH